MSCPKIRIPPIKGAQGASQYQEQEWQEGQVARAHWHMPMVSPFAVGKEEALQGWESPSEVADTDKQHRRDMEKLRSDQEKVKQELGGVKEGGRKQFVRKRKDDGGQLLGPPPPPAKGQSCASGSNSDVPSDRFPWSLGHQAKKLSLAVGTGKFTRGTELLSSSAFCVASGPVCLKCFVVCLL